MPPGASIGEHQHDGEAVDLKPGDMHLCPNGSKHSIENRTDKDATVIALIMNDLAEG